MPAGLSKDNMLRRNAWLTCYFRVNAYYALMASMPAGPQPAAQQPKAELQA
jgi:hypothetical protein